MLQLERKTPRSDGFYHTAKYQLAIVNINEGVLNFETPELEFTFEPNPVDVNDAMQIPNVVQPDQGGGFYVEVNDVGVKTISLSGTTGQFPGQSASSRLLARAGFGGVARAANAASNLLGISERATGYSKFMELDNFIRAWLEYIRLEPWRYAMLFVNHKDVEFYQVVPMEFSKPRTAARPLQYAYTLSLQVIDEHRPSGAFTRTNWLDQVDNVSNQISRWRNAVNQAVIIASDLANGVLTGTWSTVLSPVRDITNMMNSLASGIEGLVYTANSISSMGETAGSSFMAAAENLFSSLEPDGTLTHSSPGSGGMMGQTGYTRNSVLGRNTENIVPPTRSACAAVFAPTREVASASTATVNESNPGGTRPGLNPDDPFIDQYGSSLELMLNGYLGTELAPMPDYTPSAGASEGSRHMHQAARSGGAGYLEGRENELASATLSAETYISGGVRHPAVFPKTSAKSYSFSYMAAMVMSAWARSNDIRVSPELNSFRRGFLGMRDPASLSPLYRVVDVTTTDTVYSLAVKYLGTWKRWFEIVLLNDLRYPYISTYGGQYCRTPGESIYIPLENATIQADLVQRLINITKVHDRVSLQDAFLGFDMEIGHDGDTVFEKYDCAHIAGMKAYEQEMGMVLEGTGGITSDRHHGPKIKIGTKSRGGASLSLWIGLIRQWLINDPRVAEVVALKAVQEGDAVYYYTKLKFQNYDSTVTVAGELRPN
jgi:hypothetical protein